MSQSFKVKVNESYNFNFSEQEIENIDLIETTKNSYHILKDNESLDATTIASNFNQKKYTIQVNGNNYEVEISNELNQLISELGLEVSSTKKANDVKAPMPGLIVSVDVNEGQEVKEGDGMLVLEAMKMENTLIAPKDGIVKFITVSAGDKVDKNAVLIEME